MDAKHLASFPLLHWMDQNFLQHLVTRTHDQSWKENLMQELKWRQLLFASSKHWFSPSCKITYMAILLHIGVSIYRLTIDKHPLLKHKSCNMRHQQQVDMKCAIQSTQDDMKSVQHNRHKSTNMCATQSTQVDIQHDTYWQHSCMYLFTMNLSQVLYLHIQNLMHMYTLQLSLSSTNKYKNPKHMSDHKSWTEW